MSANRQSFAERWVERATFEETFGGLSHSDYVDRLYAGAGLTAPDPERDALFAALDAGTFVRAEMVKAFLDSIKYRSRLGQ